MALRTASFFPRGLNSVPSAPRSPRTALILLGENGPRPISLGSRVVQGHRQGVPGPLHFLDEGLLQVGKECDLPFRWARVAGLSNPPLHLSSRGEGDRHSADPHIASLVASRGRLRDTAITVLTDPTMGNDPTPLVAVLSP